MQLLTGGTISVPLVVLSGVFVNREGKEGDIFN